MLTVCIAPGESLLVVGEVEIFLVERHSEKGADLNIAVNETRSMALQTTRGGEFTVCEVEAGGLHSVYVPLGSILRFDEINIFVARFRKSRIKLTVNAPKRFKVKRPAQHGGLLKAE